MKMNKTMSLYTVHLSGSFAILLLLLVAASGIYPMGSTGKITGRITDSSTQEALPFVNVIIQGTTLGAASDQDGYYHILNVPPGIYTVKVSAIGYTSVVFREVRVSIDLTTKLDIQLNPTSISLDKEIVVVAQRPLVTKDLTASTSVISAEQIASLPVTEFSEVLQLQAGVVGGNVRGGRQGEVVYAIDGIPVTDVYDGSTVVDVNTNTIQELQFISGAFNAEYGKALSAYVNIATKEGSEKFSGTATAYAGDYISSHKSLFRGIDHINPGDLQNYEASLSGPVYKNLVSFFLNARYYNNDGWLYGRKDYNPWDITINKGSSEPLSSRYLIQKSGGGGLVSMNYNKKIYLQGKLTVRPWAPLKLNYNYILEKNNYKDYDHSFSLNPDGDFKKFRNGNTNILTVTHTLGNNTFYQAGLSYFYKTYRQFVYEDVHDPRYTHMSLLTQEPDDVPSFRTGGTQRQHFTRTTGTVGLKYDISSQITQKHMLKAGLEVNQHRLSYEDILLLQEDNLSEPSRTGNPFVAMRVPDENNPDENLSMQKYIRKPVEFSAYIQDKIEFEDFIVNIGLRFDYFKPEGRLLNDPSDPDIYRPRRTENLKQTMAERLSHWYKNPSVKSQLSPRLGIAFPITDKGVIHFSYGHFFQIPNFEYLYQNQEYEFGGGTGNLGLAGNPDLKPEQTINGEVGLQQAFGEDISVDLTGYFRDIRDLTGTRADEIRLFGGTESYSQFVNSDFGFVRGIVLSVNKRFSNGWTASIDYTLQTAKGNASDPAATRDEYVSGKRPEMQLVRLNSDQTHTVNATFSYTSNDNWGFSFIAQYGSGFPYTPAQSINISELLTNTELKPSTYNVDIRIFKDFLSGPMRFSIFAKVYNLLDTKNQLNVYNDSGSADFTINEYLRRQDNLPAIVNTLDEYYRNPSYYSAPRRVELGASIFF